MKYNEYIAEQREREKRQLMRAERQYKRRYWDAAGAAITYLFIFLAGGRIR